MNKFFIVLQVWLVLGTSLSIIAGRASAGECRITLSQWQADNKRFYDELEPTTFLDRRDRCGLTDCPDLRHPALMALLERQNNRSGSILEIGGGFGRAVSFLLHETSIPRIEVIEHSNANMRILRDLYKRQARVRLHHQSVLDPIPGLRVNVALWMWAGFLEVAPQHKPVALNNVYQILNDGGFLVIDIPPVDTHLYTNALFVNTAGRFLNLTLPGRRGTATIHLHFMSQPEIIEAAATVGLIHIKTVNYVVPSSARSSTRFPTRTLLIFERE